MARKPRNGSPMIFTFTDSERRVIERYTSRTNDSLSGACRSLLALGIAADKVLHRKGLRDEPAFRLAEDVMGTRAIRTLVELLEEDWS